MSSLFSCLGKKSKSKKKKNGKPPENKQTVEEPLVERDKEHPIEEIIPAEKVDGQLECTEENKDDTGPVQCTEEPEETPLIKELKSKLSIKRSPENTEAIVEESEKSTGINEKTKDEKDLVSEIVEKSVIQSVGAEIVKIESKATEIKKLSKSESLSETNYQLSEENQRLKKKCEEYEKCVATQSAEVQKLKNECSSLKQSLNYQNAIKEREDIVASIEQLTSTCSSLQERLNKTDTKRSNNNSSLQDVENKLSVIDHDHDELNTNIKNTLKCVQEIECRVINLELDKENSKIGSDEIEGYNESNESPSKTRDEQKAKVIALEADLQRLSEGMEILRKENETLKTQNSNNKLKEQAKQLSVLEKEVDKLNQDVCKLVEENKQLKNKLLNESDLEKKHKTLQDKDDKRNEEIQMLNKENEKLKNQITEALAKENDQSFVLKSAFEEVDKLKADLGRLMEDNNELNGRLRSQEETNNVKGYIAELQKELEKRNSEILKLEEENKELSGKFKTVLDRNATGSALEKELKDLKAELSRLQGENKNLQNNVDGNKQLMKSKDEKLQSLQNAERELQNMTKSLETRLTQLEARHKSEKEEMSVTKKKLEKTESQLREKEIAHQDTIKKLAEAQTKQEELLKRSNPIGNDKVLSMNGSPRKGATCMSLADDGTLKIGEKFRALFETTWRETFDKLHTVCKRDERKVLLILIEYLTECYLYCRRTARHQMDAVLSLLVSPANMRGSLNKRFHGKVGQTDNIPGALKQNIMVFRRTPSESFVESLFEEFMNVVDYQKSRHLRNIQARDITEVTQYVRECVGVCWEMVTQEPPMYLLFKLRHNQIIEKDKFDVFSNDGNKVDFLVWPALLRDENGQLLQKGVVQAMRS